MFVGTISQFESLFGVPILEGQTMQKVDLQANFHKIPFQVTWTEFLLKYNQFSGNFEGLESTRVGRICICLSWKIFFCSLKQKVEYYSFQISWYMLPCYKLISEENGRFVSVVSSTIMRTHSESDERFIRNKLFFPLHGKTF